MPIAGRWMTRRRNCSRKTSLNHLTSNPISSTSNMFYQVLFPIMKLFSFIPLLLDLTQVVFSHSGRTDSKGGHRDRAAGKYRYHNLGTVPRTSVPSSPKAYSKSFCKQQYSKKLGGRTELTMPDGNASLSPLWWIGLQSRQSLWCAHHRSSERWRYLASKDYFSDQPKSALVILPPSIIGHLWKIYQLPS